MLAMLSPSIPNDDSVTGLAFRPVTQFSSRLPMFATQIPHHMKYRNGVTGDGMITILQKTGRADRRNNDAEMIVVYIINL